MLNGHGLSGGGGHPDDCLETGRSIDAEEGADTVECQREQGASCAAMVALYVIFPVVIESFGRTYPVSNSTVIYVMCLFLASLMMVVYHFVKNRREPNQQSVSIIILGLLGGAAMMALFAILAWRSRPARSHDGQAVGVTGDRLSARPHWHGLSKRTRGRFSTQYAFHIAANECDHPLLSFLRKRADVWRQDDVVHLFQ